MAKHETCLERVENIVTDPEFVTSRVDQKKENLVYLGLVSIGRLLIKKKNIFTVIILTCTCLTNAIVVIANLY